MQYNKRSLYILLICMVLTGILACRFFQIQIIKGDQYSKLADRQQLSTAKLDDVRGNIYDRNLIPLTNRVEKLYPIIKSEMILHGTRRYDKNSIAKHITGYLSLTDNKGITGMEGFYEPYLSKGATLKLMTVKDAAGNPILGVGYRVGSDKDVEEPLNLMLTIDYHIQNICEDILKQINTPSAVVVQEVSSGDILAMVSKPDFEHNNISDYINSTNGEFNNRTTMGYNLGSVFKTVVTAAALEDGIPLNYAYYCDGGIKIGNNIIKCHTFETGGHGVIDLENAFPQSCNTYFIDLGQQLGYKKIYNMAQKFGFGIKTGIEGQGIKESAGFMDENTPWISAGETANLSIGQGTFLATPLQVSRMMNTIANNGVMDKINIVDGLMNKEGVMVKSLRQEGSQQVLSPSVAAQLKHLLEKVVSEGTGKSAGKGLQFNAAGKTGSAETGAFEEGGRQIVHSWFSGFYPAENAKYTITVFVEDGVGKSVYATSIFCKIASQIDEIGYSE